jgi:DNA-binding response OmpR family regulator
VGAEVPEILIVEDDADVRALFAARIKMEGWTHSFAENGEECIIKIKEKQPDLILLDVMMPKIDGYNTCFMIKENEKYSHIPILMITAKTEPYEQAKGKMVGADEYICKPFDINDIIATIKKYLK